MKMLVKMKNTTSYTFDLTGKPITGTGNLFSILEKAQKENGDVTINGQTFKFSELYSIEIVFG